MREVYLNELSRQGLILTNEYIDEGEKHYFDFHKEGCFLLAPYKILLLPGSTVCRNIWINVESTLAMIRIDIDKNIAFIEVGGTPAHIEIQEAIDELLKHPEHSDGMDEIWDFRKASMISFNEKELRTLAGFVKERLPRLARRVAYVIAENVDYGIGRMWMAYAEMSDAIQERQLFMNLDEAEEWLLSTYHQ